MQSQEAAQVRAIIQRPFIVLATKAICLVGILSVVPMLLVPKQSG
jgi:hypothetical protein